MRDRLRILHLEDEPGDAMLIQETLEADGVACCVTRVDTEATFVASLEQGDFDLILADYTLPSFDGLYALKLARQARSHVPFIFVSGTLGEELAIDALKIGATDYVFKTRLSRIVPSVRRALREAEERSELSRADEALRHAEAELARVARLTTVGELTASLAHEINQPLTAIMNNGTAGLRWLIRDTPDLAEARNAFEEIVRDAARAGEVIRGIRALVMKRGPQLERLDIDDVVQEVLAFARGERQQHGVALHTDLATSGRLVLGDRVQLQQVVLNLILNGIDAMKTVTDRARELTVSTAFHEPASLLVGVEDTGTGLDPAVARHIFEPFYTTKSDGLGMGLSICRSIVHGHGGELWASTRTPHGTALRFTIPLAQ